MNNTVSQIYNSEFKYLLWLVTDYDIELIEKLR